MPGKFGKNLSVVSANVQNSFRQNSERGYFNSFKLMFLVSCMTRPSETYLQNVLRESKGVSFTFSNKKLLASFIVILHLC